MRFLADFYTEYSRKIPIPGANLKWRVEEAVFLELQDWASENALSLEAGSFILFYPIEVGSTLTGTVELIEV
ncbi:hypothetical protein [Sphingobium tyrosinilyticum]|uniref:Uncharacterized protein n=1 Tax=Sphingobium tyrosinilyticum TaxID=2715436 RepID=A0ABV9F3Z9_9SPHN